MLRLERNTSPVAPVAGDVATASRTGRRTVLPLELTIVTVRVNSCPTTTGRGAADRATRARWAFTGSGEAAWAVPALSPSSRSAPNGATRVTIRMLPPEIE